ncbi:protein translocase subunit SecDF [Virgibacillus sp. 179-BFC.A HS]|uniref:Multifunctional fusion protein n=1 Tax=Tigheibacillus jepli TaxID=3035914 RepID=A0ABU5CI15_9BACI|nr:protein translocase subunit SecDF [Virgibacillus sp. 179-BFC.A HS]MDY0405477.1 protein translocase subunit SecDF [Virgibacillus sp. 179-BFC.A HS]
MKNKGKLVAFFLIVIILGVTIGSTTNSIVKKINLGLDLQGGFEILYEVKPINENQTVTRELLEGTVQTLNDRVNRLGISESTIDIEGKDRIRVQLAGVKDQQQARDLLATSARLSFRDVDDKKLLDGSDVKEGSAKQDFDPKTNQPIVTLKLKDANKFAKVTTEVKNMAPNNLLVIWMDYNKGDSFKEESKKKDPKYISAPAVNETLNTNNVQITGNFTVEEAKYMADIINSGSLPVQMKELYSTSVGAQFGEQALNKTVVAGIIGVALVYLFMIFFYRFPGLIASINLTVYIYLILLVFMLMNGVLTLPGIAALILGVGMAVDANVITFERIKEEMRAGKSLQSSFKAGTKNSLSTILDANITTMLAAVILFIFGTSSVKGFATLLIISVLVSFLTAVYGTRLLLHLWIKVPFFKKHPEWFGVKKNTIRDINDTDTEVTFHNRKVNVVKHRKKFFIASGTMVIIGIIFLTLFKINPGIDFTSGSRVEILSNHALSTQEITNDLSDLDLKAKSIVISGDNKDIGVARFDKVLSNDKIKEVKQYFADKYHKGEPNVSIVSPIVGQELVKNALYAVGLAAIGMIIYVAFRFEVFFGITAIIALIHDAFFILVLFSITRMEFDVTIVAAILTIIGYSINDTIVTFDRIRENLQKSNKRIKSMKELAKVVNNSLMQTFTRSINTSLTTLLAILPFLLFGATSIKGFAISMMVGLVVGTYSSLFLAAQLWLVWRGRMLKKRPVDFRKKKKLEGPQV